MDEILKIAGFHAARLEEDIKMCRTRDEHLRVTARANEAFELLNRLVALGPENINGEQS